VCDNHFGLNGAVRAAFPEAELYLCEWHLRHALERLMAKIRLHANRQDDPLAYAGDIRAWLEANNGRPRVSRRAVADPAGQPSLR